MALRNRKPTRRCAIRAGAVISISLALTLTATYEQLQVLRSLGILISIYGCTYLVTGRTSLHADVLDREYGRGYDGCRDDMLAMSVEEFAELKAGESADGAVAAAVLPFDRAAHQFAQQRRVGDAGQR